MFGSKNKALGSFSAWKVVETPKTEKSEFGYSLKMAHIVVQKSQHKSEDKVLYDDSAYLEDIKRIKEEEAKKKKEGQALYEKQRVNQGNVENDNVLSKDKLTSD